MKYLCLSTDDPEKLRIPPTPEQFATIGAFMVEAAQSGKIYLTGGVRPSESAIRIDYEDGKPTHHRRPVRGGEGAGRRFRDHRRRIRATRRSTGSPVSQRRPASTRWRSASCSSRRRWPHSRVRERAVMRFLMLRWATGRPADGRPAPSSRRCGRTSTTSERRASCSPPNPCSPTRTATRAPLRRRGPVDDAGPLSGRLDSRSTVSTSSSCAAWRTRSPGGGGVRLTCARDGGDEPRSRSARSTTDRARDRRDPRRDRGGLAHRIRPAHRRARADRPRRGHRRRAGPGRARRRARAMARVRASRATRARGSWGPPSIAPSTCSAGGRCSTASTRSSAGARDPAGRDRRRIRDGDR